MKTEIQWSLSYNKSEEETKRLKVEIIRGIFVRQVWRKPVSSCLGYTLDNSQVEYCLGPFPPGRIPRIQIKFEMIFIFFAHFSTSTLMDLKTLQTHTHTHTHTVVQWWSICLPGQEMQVPYLGQEDPLEKEMETHSSILAGKSLGQRSLVGYSPWGRKRVRHDLATKQ